MNGLFYRDHFLIELLYKIIRVKFIHNNITNKKKIMEKMSRFDSLGFYR